VNDRIAMSEPPNAEVAVFAAALELPADQRGAYLDQACAGNIELRRRVEALLRVHDDAGSFFDKLASVGRPTSVEGVTPGPGGAMRIPAIPAEKPGARQAGRKHLQIPARLIITPIFSPPPERPFSPTDSSTNGSPQSYRLMLAP
jgi:hypothetical protein